MIVTFVFSVYLTSSVGEHLPGSVSASTWYGISVGIAGLLIAVLAPVTGQQGDAGGHRRRSLAVFSALITACIVGLFWVHDEPSYFVLGAALIGLGSVFFEIGAVFYNAMLRQISTPATIGRVSGFGWSMGYFGGIILLLFVYFGFISGDGAVQGFFGVSSEDAFNIRVVALVAAAWFGLFALPVLFAVPEIRPGPAQRRRGILAAYRLLFADIAVLWRTDRQAAVFLLASAVFRDGLAGVFHFGAILAGTVYGIAADQVLIFGVAANVTAALGAVGAGFLDDRFGPRRVIVGSLVGLLVSGTVLLFLSGPAAFWVFGLLLTLFVGPAQSASRTYLARSTPPGRESELFGLYATTGRAVSFLSPLLFALFAGVFAADRAGIVGILLVLAVGLVLVLPLRDPVDKAVPAGPVATDRH
ncbi:MFS transporter [Nakamurella endophytica]|uniref:MFS transporter n=1 Tax=Nakamurella endophytica TaxID=1748367 RepID=A0A917SPV5_9ACTN|nr:MFS transporter [Nakamurella endophytica]